MIKARRLFLVPALGAFLVLIPVIGWFFYIMVCLIWAKNNWDDITAYFRGYKYRQNEYSEDQQFIGL